MPVYTDYISATIMYNLQILPESLITGLVILAILLANYSVAILAASMAGTQLLTGTIGRLLAAYMPDMAKVTTSLDMCNTGYVGKTWNRLLRGTESPEMLWHPLAPSIFMVTVSFLAGWGVGLRQLYKEEINAGVLSASTMTTTTIISFMVVLLAFLFRYMSGCESAMGAIGGTIIGLLLGYFICIAVGFASDRKLTNIWGIPLLRDRINNGAPLYVCTQ